MIAAVNIAVQKSPRGNCLFNLKRGEYIRITGSRTIHNTRPILASDITSHASFNRAGFLYSVMLIRLPNVVITGATEALPERLTHLSSAAGACNRWGFTSFLGLLPLLPIVLKWFRHSAFSASEWLIKFLPVVPTEYGHTHENQAEDNGKRGENKATPVIRPPHISAH